MPPTESFTQCVRPLSGLFVLRLKTRGQEEQLKSGGDEMPKPVGVVGPVHFSLMILCVVFCNTKSQIGELQNQDREGDFLLGVGVLIRILLFCYP